MDISLQVNPDIDKEHNDAFYAAMPPSGCNEGTLQQAGTGETPKRTGLEVALIGRP